MTRRVVVLGPTASGKSDAAMAAATAVAGTEIVTVDAMQLYRGMDIGTATPGIAEQAAAPHHCLDLVGPDVEMDVIGYRAAYDRAMASIGERGGRALLVAGTGLYLTAVLDDLRPPGRWPAVRADLERQPDLGALVAQLQHLDPVAAHRIEPGNRRRVVRALEVTLGSGRPFSSFGPGVAAHPPTDATLIGLRWPRSVLGERIDRRVDSMMAAGLLAEVAALRADGPGLSRTARQAIGYKELLDHLDGLVGLDEAVATIKARTRRFATRQERWFRRDPRVRWIDIEHDPVAEASPPVVDALTR